MNKYKLAAIASLVCVAAVTLSGHGQQAPPPQQQPQAQPANPREGMLAEPMGGGGGGGYSVMLPPPLTRLEALAAEKGVIIVKGFTDIGTLQGDDGSSVLVSAVQFSDGTAREHGVAFRVEQPLEGRSVRTTAYVDEQELDGLIGAVDALSKLQEGAASPLQQFDARYQTGGALELVSTNVNGGRVILVRALELRPGAVQPEIAEMRCFVSRLPELGQRLTTAKDLLARAKAAAQQQPQQPQPQQ